MRSEKPYPTPQDYPASRSAALKARLQTFFDYIARGESVSMATRLAHTSSATIRLLCLTEPMFEARILWAKERHRRALLKQREAEFWAGLAALAPRALIEEDLAKLNGHQYEALLPVWAKRFSDIKGGVPVRKRHEKTCWVWPVDDLRPGAYFWNG